LNEISPFWPRSIKIEEYWVVANGTVGAAESEFPDSYVSKRRVVGYSKRDATR
jgi:hypothetical protein